MTDRTSAPLTSDQIHATQQQAVAIAGAGTHVIQPKQFVFFAAFDGTNNIKDDPAFAGDPQMTSVGQIFEQFDIARGDDSSLAGQYYAGPGTPGTEMHSSFNPAMVTKQIKATANEAYEDFAEQALQWLAEDPTRSASDITIVTMGFSRGAPIAVVLTQLVAERGLKDRGGNVLIPPLDPTTGLGGVPVAALLGVDSVSTGYMDSLAIGQNVNAENIVMIRALNEFRIPFPSDDYSADPRVQTYEFTGNHGDIGAFYDNGLSGLSLEAQTALLQSVGLTLADVPVDRQFDPTKPVVIHSEVFDSFGNRQWDEYGTPGTRLLHKIDGPRLVGEFSDKVASTSVASNGDQTMTHRIVFKDGGVMTRILDSKGKPVLTAQADEQFTANASTGMYAVFNARTQETSTYNAFTQDYTEHSAAGLAITGNRGTGEYHMQIPKTDGSGGFLVYSRTENDDGEPGYLVREFELDAQGHVLNEFTGWQHTLVSELVPVTATRSEWVAEQVRETRSYQGYGALPASQSLQFDSVSYNLLDFNQRMDAEYALYSLKANPTWNDSANYWNSFTQRTVDYSLAGSSGGGYGLVLPQDGGFWDTTPIGAFYDSQSSAFDQAPGIARYMARALFRTGDAIAAQQLAALDVNGDGQLSVSESSSLLLWRDMNENGVFEVGEVGFVEDRIDSSGYDLLTRGNGQKPWPSPLLTIEFPSVPGSPTPLAPTLAAPAGPAFVNAPASNYRALRTGEELFPMNSSFFSWAPTQIKLTWSKNTYQNMVGTDGNDSFDGNYFASSPSYISQFIGRVQNFYAGDGDDLMGGSARPDNLWGGTGNDTLYGYAGSDRMYGEEGDDALFGHEGDDWIDGGVGRDLLLGGAGQDSLWGGAGDDQLIGDEGDDQLSGGVGNDVLFGKLGNDSLWGDDGDDDLQGQEGNDNLVGGAGNDRMFGQVGNDVLWGGDGDDILVGFTTANELQQTLAAGQTDNDLLFGGTGNDNLYGGFGSDKLDGGVGHDLLLGGDGDDALWGGDGNDELQGNAGDDRLIGGMGDDNLFGQVGNDLLWGGDGNDILVGFTADNESKQTLSLGESDDDVMNGGAGDDILIGGLGMDTLVGGVGRDELQGGVGNDMLYGEAGDDNLFGQLGNDTLYGGDGDDYLTGFTGSNETRQRLNPGETDDDWLYGGAGRDTLVSGVGDDYLDGGAGADVMVGGQGDDVYIVNSVNDAIHEVAGEGRDVVVTNINYLLNANVEELRLLEGFSIHGTGNALDNKIIGNSSENILDGVTGADTMEGGRGNDTYYVDDAGDVVVEHADAGIDVVQSSVDYTLGGDVENLVLLDFAKPEKGLVDGKDVLVYGYPKRNELDYMQGDAVASYAGTCALTSIANLLTQSGNPTTESQVVRLAINNQWTVSDPQLPASELGGSSVSDQRNILSSYGVRNDVVAGFNESGLANLVRAGRGVVLAVNAGVLWGEPAYLGLGAVNHAVTLTGVVYNATTGELEGFYLSDSGRGLVSDQTRFVDAAMLRSAADVQGAYAIYSIEPVKFWQENINGTGNVLNNQLVGNRGANVLLGLAGDDTLVGEAGNDTYVFQLGDGYDTVDDNDATSGNRDTIEFRTGIVPTDLAPTRVGQDLVLAYGAADSVTVKNWFAGDAHVVEHIRFADGTVWNSDQVSAATHSDPAESSAANAGERDTAQSLTGMTTGAIHDNEAVNGFTSNATPVPLDHRVNLAAERMWQSMFKAHNGNVGGIFGNRNSGSRGQVGNDNESGPHSGAGLPNIFAPGHVGALPPAPNEMTARIYAKADAWMAAMATSSAQTSFTPLQQSVVAPVIAANLS
ncbi:calcium-binding protein [Hydrogenophaga sp.]|uniref:calcium-binding protein n=1 Tax=Hydrogenophaga sp. TaxID=1904254 RepID=UPI002719F64D|nr:calcium-binding protein [Hydrogenophaga sp.]MDO9437983.1 calcium-binding protein [Hydrogenophaga sp.]